MDLMDTPRWPRPTGENARLEVLHSLRALDRPRDADLDRLARLASHLCGAPSAVVHLVDSDRVWPAAAWGPTAGELPRDVALCGYSILSRDVTYLPDASLDPGFADNPLVTGPGGIRLYVAAPLIVADEHVIGSLCAFGDEPGRVSQAALERMRDLASTTVRLLELSRAAGALAQAATRDPLTGLPNRTLFDEALGRALARQERENGRAGLLFVDLDGFKRLNDTYGHAVGDEALREVASRLVGCARDTDLVCRFGGDEFVVLVEEADNGRTLTGLSVLAQRIRMALAEPAQLPGGLTLGLPASVGVARARVSDTAESLLARADHAMYADKPAD